MKDSPSKKSFGDYIRDRRIELRLTQQDVARKARVSQNFVAYLENGHRKPSTPMIRKLSEALGLPSDKLYFLARDEELQGVILFDAKEGQLHSDLSPILKALKNDRDLRDRHRISDEDIAMLAAIRGRGDIKTKEDYVFVLMSIRQVMR